MTCNIGKTDKIIRVIAGLVIAVLGFYFKSWWGLLAIIPLLTAAIGNCPLYIPFKISTIEKKKAE
jgi:hypothetical protein